jgi:hypothetical protein
LRSLNLSRLFSVNGAPELGLDQALPSRELYLDRSPGRREATVVLFETALYSRPLRGLDLTRETLSDGSTGGALKLIVDLR